MYDNACYKFYREISFSNMCPTRINIYINSKKNKTYIFVLIRKSPVYHLYKNQYTYICIYPLVRSKLFIVQIYSGTPSHFSFNFYNEQETNLAKWDIITDNKIKNDVSCGFTCSRVYGDFFNRVRATVAMFGWPSKRFQQRWHWL